MTEILDASKQMTDKEINIDAAAIISFFEVCRRHNIRERQFEDPPYGSSENSLYSLINQIGCDVAKKTSLANAVVFSKRLLPSMKPAPA